MLAAMLLVGAIMLTQAFPVDPGPERVTERVILLPEADGSVGGLDVSTASGAQSLDSAYAAAERLESGAIQAAQSSAAEVASRFGNLLAGQPRQPASYLIYFELGSDEMTPESRRVLELLKEDVSARQMAEVRVVGHSDSTGSDALNDRLSLERARYVVGILKSLGMEALEFEAVGKGEREPLLDTGDGVAEPRNRRVEVSVR